MHDELVHALEGRIPRKLATELTDDFFLMRRDLAAGMPGRAAPGKFVETLVQALQFLNDGTYDEHPSVDRALQALESSSTLSDGLRICAPRIARSMYTLRNSRLPDRSATRPRVGGSRLLNTVPVNVGVANRRRRRLSGRASWRCRTAAENGRMHRSATRPANGSSRGP